MAIPTFVPTPTLRPARAFCEAEAISPPHAPAAAPINATRGSWLTPPIASTCESASPAPVPIDVPVTTGCRANQLEPDFVTVCGSALPRYASQSVLRLIAVRSGVSVADATSRLKETGCAEATDPPTSNAAAMSARPEVFRKPMRRVDRLCIVSVLTPYCARCR